MQMIKSFQVLQILFHKFWERELSEELNFSDLENPALSQFQQPQQPIQPFRQPKDRFCSNKKPAFLCNSSQERKCREFQAILWWQASPGLFSRRNRRQSSE